MEKETKTWGDHEVQGGTVSEQHQHKIRLLRASLGKVVLQTEQTGLCRQDGVEVDEVTEQGGS